MGLCARSGTKSAQMTMPAMCWRRLSTCISSKEETESPHGLPLQFLSSFSQCFSQFHKQLQKPPHMLHCKVTRYICLSTHFRSLRNCSDMCRKLLQRSL